ncbi:cobalamin-5'-phosphate synthase [Nocardioides exalbidus]|uniref:Adenosylcobinamide-GDP ribazoletransferase n=1 Tax=Nocardioides exalbidus TaxID=402596 RepID=A0A1H4W8J6_9ACTN|nr:adenosylcobinamide-GDP ribazoletransferase [Nocardioides exalbidus]SEC89593.1 cobalamin-5'-phosphate synthase [Nocardioides exalbidus]
MPGLDLGREAWLLATGTLTAFRVPMPSRVDRSVAGLAMALAPVAALPLGVVAGLVVLVGEWIDLPPLATAYVVVLALALGTRAFHWDGLADTADGLTASYSRERSLEVMRTGPVGPAGVVAVVLVASLQAAGLTAVVRHEHGWLAVALLVCASRACLAVACVRGVPAARADGLGATHIGAVPVVAAVASLVVGGVAVALAGDALGSAWPTLAGLVLMVAAVVALLMRCVRRLGGITGDVLGAAVEVSFAVLVLAAATV